MSASWIENYLQLEPIPALSLSRMLVAARANALVDELVKESEKELGEFRRQ